MPKLTIDQRELEVPSGSTILDAAASVGIEIPTLCFLKAYRPSTSCLVCLVKLNGNARLVPACATRVDEGMRVETRTDDVLQARRTALELLLSDHLGDCLAPCYFGCPAHMDIPLMLRQIAAGQLREAIATVKRDIALPAVLGRICPAPCEKACRRKPADGPVAICRLKRFVADTDLDGNAPYLPLCDADTGKQVAVVGAGPTGLAAAYYLRQQGNAVTVLERTEKPGGRLWIETSEEELPRDVLQAEIDTILRLGVTLNLNRPIDALDDLCGRFDAVLLACGSGNHDWGLATTPRGVRVEKETYRTDRQGVFACGNAVRGKGMVVRSAADGKEAAVAIDQYLIGQTVTGPGKPLNSRIGRLEPDELAQYLAGASESPRRDPADGYAADEAVEQAARCMHCDCRKLHNCKLRQCSAEHQADPRHFAAERRRFQQDRQHAEVIYESGKCIDCGLCIEIATQAKESLGLTFIGRGFDVRVGVPLNRTLDEALEKVATKCVEACPTAALAMKSP